MCIPHSPLLTKFSPSPSNFPYIRFLRFPANPKVLNVTHILYMVYIM